MHIKPIPAVRIDGDLVAGRSRDFVFAAALLLLPIGFLT